MKIKLWYLLILLTLCGLVCAFLYGLRVQATHWDDYVMIIVLSISVLLTAVLSLINFGLLFTRPDHDKRDKILRYLEPFGMIYGGLFAVPLTAELLSPDWNEAIYEGEYHAALSRAHVPTLVAFAVLALVGYVVLRFVSLEKLPPLLAILSMSAVLVGGVLVVVFLLQLAKSSPLSIDENLNFFLVIYLINLVIIALRLLSDTVIRYGRGEGRQTRFPFLNRLLGRCLLLPIAVVLVALPLLFFVVVIMMLFGQQPDSLIRVWTETADWTFSQMTPPPSIPYDGHYLCTVAASGHRRVVKPLRTGVRHGHTVVVNRQLQVANAFEELLAERMPRFHRVVRNAYDTIGLPIAKNVKSPYVCDAIYWLMKPLEWLFLLVLYSCDSKPENRIARQYPHRPLLK